MSEIIKIKKVAETEPIDVLVEKSLSRTANISRIDNKNGILNTASIDISVNNSMSKTAEIELKKSNDTIVNTQSIEMPVYRSLSTYGEKDIFLNGGETKSLSIIVGKDNIVYGNVKYNSLNNALSIKDDGLYVKPILYTTETDENMVLSIDNTNQLIKSEIKNSPKLNNKFENELSVNEALNFKHGGNIDAAFNNKVDKILGKGLSTCDYTQEEKSKLYSIDTSHYIKLFDYDNTNNKFIIQSDNYTNQIPLIGLIKGVNFDGALNKLTFNTTNGPDVVIDLYKDIFIVDGSYDSETKNIILNLSNGNTINIPATDIIPSFNGNENNNIKTNVSVDNVVSAELKISKDSNNTIISKQDGIYVPLVDKNSLGINNIDNTPDSNKILSVPQKQYVDSQIANINDIMQNNYLTKTTNGDVNIKSENGKIVFYVNSSPKLEINAQGVNFLL